MLFINVDLITELLGYRIHKCNKENKLMYYDEIINTSLEEDILFNKIEQKVINCFCELEIYRSSLIGKNIANNIRSSFNISMEMEKELFTKLFVRDYLAKQEKRSDLLLINYLSSNKLFSNVTIEEIKDSLSAIKLFKDFASPELKNDKNFCKVILELDGSYITSMGESVRNSASIMKTAISNDETYDVISFANSNSRLQNNSDLAILYLKKLKENRGRNFSAERVYKTIFQQNEGKYPTKIFKNNEQSSWLDDSRFLPQLAKIDSKFTDYIASGLISPFYEDRPKKQVKNYPRPV